MNRIVYLDLDGVLVDFIRGASEAHRRPNPYENGNGAGVWHTEKLWGITEEEFWQPLRTHEFWENLHWTPDGKEILALVESTFGKENIVLLSKTDDSPYSASGKVAWIQREMPEYKDRYFLCGDKQFVAHAVTGTIWGGLLHRWAKDAAKSAQPIAVPPALACLCMVGLKLSRESFRHKRDNLVDAAGYSLCAELIHEKETPTP